MAEENEFQAGRTPYFVSHPGLPVGFGQRSPPPRRRSWRVAWPNLPVMDGPMRAGAAVTGLQILSGVSFLLLEAGRPCVPNGRTRRGRPASGASWPVSRGSYCGPAAGARTGTAAPSG
ncbi:MAG TPA: hypothetical protein VKP11_04660 [Frankiaceae bacterium]|nr:hypothetical protein [Frankiaceae bacterium]